MTWNSRYGPVLILKRNYYIKIVIRPAIKTVLWYRDLTKNTKIIGSLDDLTRMITYGPKIWFRYGYVICKILFYFRQSNTALRYSS